MREFLDLASNPMFTKHVRSRLRRSALLPGVIITLFLSMCIVFINEVGAKNAINPDPDIGSQMFFFFQGILLVLMGGSQVAGAIAQMKESGIIDFHRITPIPPKVQTIGILIGAPIRELIMYAATLPFALFLAVTGPVGIVNFSKLLLVQVGGAIMYYTLAMITGLTATKARGASGRYVALLTILNLSAVGFVTAGVYGPTLITSVPVYYEVFHDADGAAARRQQRGNRNRQAQAVQQNNQGQLNQGQVNQGQANQMPIPANDDVKKVPVNFYGLPIPLVLQSLMFQGGVLVFLFIAASRRIHSARLPLYRKPTALLFALTISFLTIGSLWDANVAPLTLGAGYFLTVFCILLINSVTPALGDIVKGLQRAHKVSNQRVPIWSDLASSKFVVLGVGLIVGVMVAVGIVQSAPNPILQDFAPWPSLLVSVLTITSFGFAAQYVAIAYGNRSKGYFVLYIFFAWLVPIIGGMIVLASDKNLGGYMLVLSPIVGIFAAGEFMPNYDPDIVRILSIAPVALTSLILMIMLFNEDRKLANEIVEEHERRDSRRRKRAMEREEVEE